MLRIQRDRERYVGQWLTEHSVLAPGIGDRESIVRLQRRGRRSQRRVEIGHRCRRLRGLAGELLERREGQTIAIE